LDLSGSCTSSTFSTSTLAAIHLVKKEMVRAKGAEARRKARASKNAKEKGEAGNNGGAQDNNHQPQHKSTLEEENGISSYLAAFAQTASFSVSQAPFCIAAAPLLLTKVSGQCCEAIIQTAVRSPLLPLFAIAATMSAMCEAAAVAPSANTATETFLSEESSISGLFNLLLWTVTVMMPMLVASKLFRVDEVNDSYSNQYVYVKSVDGRYTVIPFHPLKTIGMLKCEIERELQLLPKRYSLHAYSWKRLDTGIAFTLRLWYLQWLHIGHEHTNVRRRRKGGNE